MSLDQRGYDPFARGKHYLFTALLPDCLRDFQATNQHAFHNKQSRREIPHVVLTIELPARRQFADHHIKICFFPFKTSKQAWQPPKTFILKTKLYSYMGCRLLTRKCHRTFFQAFFARLAARLSTKPAVSHNQSINYEMSHYKCAPHSIGTCINSDDCAHQCRLSARQLTKQPHVKRIRDREPSRLPLKRIVLALRKRKNRSFLKQHFLNSAPKSSFLNMVASDYKLCCFQFVHMQHIFIKSFAYFKPSVNCRSNSQLKSGNHQYKYTNQQYHISQKKLMLSGDIEINPGPSYVLLEQRLRDVFS